MEWIYDNQVEFRAWYDSNTHCMRVKDSFGEFIPFPLSMWQHCVDKPYELYFREKGKTIRQVIEIFLGDYQHRYICNN